MPAEEIDTEQRFLRQRGRGLGSGLEVDQHDGHLFDFRAGRIVRWENFNVPAGAFEAAGISPDA